MRFQGQGEYAVTLLSVGGGLIDSDCPGVAFSTKPAADAPNVIDTLFIPGGIEAPTAAVDPMLVAAVKKLAGRAKRIACVCTGAFVAAEAGLLTGRHAATHWRYGDLFASRYSDVILEKDRIWVEDGSIWSSAGVTAGIDLTLALIETDLGASVALRVAKELVVFLKRPGGQSQFSNLLSGQIADAQGPFEKLFAWIPENLNTDLRTEALADKAGMSSRTFARKFAAQVGQTPARAVEVIRIRLRETPSNEALRHLVSLQRVVASVVNRGCDVHLPDNSKPHPLNCAPGFQCKSRQTPCICSEAGIGEPAVMGHSKDPPPLFAMLQFLHCRDVKGRTVANLSRTKLSSELRHTGQFREGSPPFRR